MTFPLSDTEGIYQALLLFPLTRLCLVKHALLKVKEGQGTNKNIHASRQH